MKKMIKTWIFNYQDFKSHQNGKSRVSKILRVIESYKGKTDPKLIKLSNDYAVDVLGWSGYAPWLYVYSAFTGCFKEGWIPDNYFEKVVIPATNYCRISSLKPLTSKLFHSDLFPDLAFYVNGLFYSTNYKIITDIKVRSVLFEKSDMVVFKLDRTSKGKGIYFFRESDFDIGTIRRLGNGVFQSYINQHAFFKELMPSSVATIRITTVMEDNGNPSLRCCYLRLGRIHETHVKAETHIQVPVDYKSGELSETGYLTDWSTINKHPDTDFLFKNRKIPNYTQIVGPILNLHKLFPLNRCIGWDVVIDDNNSLKIMEWNSGHIGIRFSEAYHGPCFSDLGWENLWKKKEQSSRVLFNKKENLYYA
jgi:hypothetical protein